jgi:hypothetical protein
LSGMNLTTEHAADKAVLVCFFDMNQRPSRNCIVQLSKQAEKLKEKGIAVIAVQASKVDANALDELIKKYNGPILFGTGIAKWILEW